MPPRSSCLYSNSCGRDCPDGFCVNFAPAGPCRHKGGTCEERCPCYYWEAAEAVRP